jgi:ankyrin repeat protein
MRRPLRKLLLTMLLLAAAAAARAEVRLVDAVKMRDRAAVRTFLAQRVDVNAREFDGTTPLHWAVYEDDLEIAELLVRAGADVKATNRYGVTPLSPACVNGNAGIIDMLLKAGADPNTRLPEGETVLMAAARTGKVDAVKLLLGAGADMNARESSREQTALMWAAAEGHVNVIRALLDRGADIHARSEIEYIPAEAQFRQSEEQHGGFTALLFAAREGQMAAVLALLEAGANVNDSLLVTRSKDAKPDAGVNVFLLAVANAHYELAARLLDWGVDPNTAPLGWTALHQLSWVRKADDAGHTAPPPQGSGNMSSVEFARKLVKHGADVNARATSRRSPAGAGGLNMLSATPFLMAARTKDPDYMRLLAELGADPRLPNADNTTALMAAAGIGMNTLDDGETENQLLETIKVAIELGNDVNATDNNGETAMHGAAYKLVPSVVHLLAEKGAVVEVWNRPNKKGTTPLEIALKTKSNRSALDSPRTADAIRELMTRAGQ